MYICAMCKLRGCETGEKEKMPENCPCLEETVDESKKLYNESENKKIAYNSALVEAEGYCRKTRIEEIMDFAKKCKYSNIGIAFCIGLDKETRILYKVLTNNGFTVNSVACKCGSIPKEKTGIKEKEKLDPFKYEPMCNPIGQALFLNKANTDLNIILGLCVGHDSLFIKYSDAPVTVLAAKDRVLGHNPLAALYLSESYYREKLYPQK